MTIVVSIYTAGAALGYLSAGLSKVAAGAIAGAIGGAVGGFAGGLVTGGIKGALRGALYGAVSGAAFGAIGGIGFGAADAWARPLAHAFAGGVMSILQGGKFGHGFISAGLAKVGGMNITVTDKVLKGVLMAVVGGTISEITGGEFANGALTAAFAYVANELSQYQRAMKIKKEAIRQNDLMTRKTDDELRAMSRSDLYKRQMAQADLATRGKMAGSNTPFSDETRMKIDSLRADEMSRASRIHAIDVKPEYLAFGYKTLATGLGVAGSCVGSLGFGCGAAASLGGYSIYNDYQKLTTGSTFNKQLLGDQYGTAADITLELLDVKGAYKAPMRLLGGDNVSDLPSNVMGTGEFIKRLDGNE
ncbi:hypothetical protein ACVBEJ_13570 [Porticoccus sp. GXU_MW_L64]